MTDDAPETPTSRTSAGPRQRWSRSRTAFWLAAALALLLPFAAMQVTDEVSWAASDFLVAGALLLGVGLAFEVVVRTTDDATYRWAVVLALGAAFVLVWATEAVGVIGSEADDVNVLYYGVLGVGAVGAVGARFRPRGMARALTATALAQGAVAAGALVGGWGAPASGPLEVVALNGAFVALWAGSAALFRRAAHEPPPSGARPVA